MLSLPKHDRHPCCPIVARHCQLSREQGIVNPVRTSRERERMDRCKNKTKIRTLALEQIGSAKTNLLGQSACNVALKYQLKSDSDQSLLIKLQKRSNLK